LTSRTLRVTTLPVAIIEPSRYLEAQILDRGRNRETR
jgi:hypothetical protein